MKEIAEDDNLEIVEDGNNVLVNGTLDAYWVLEEHIPVLEDEKKSSGSDRWYIERLDELLIDKIDAERDLEETLREIIMELKDEWNHLDKKEKKGLGYTPSASIGLVRLDEDKIDYFVFGGAGLIITNSVMNKVESDVNTGMSPKERRKIEELKEKVGLTHQEAIKELRAHKKDKDAELDELLSFDEENVFLAKTGFFNRKEFDELLLFNQGYRKIADGYDVLDSWEDILESARDGLESTVEKIRDVEENDPDLKKHPRLKKHVDVGVARIDL